MTAGASGGHRASTGGWPSSRAVLAGGTRPVEQHAPLPFLLPDVVATREAAVGDLCQLLGVICDVLREQES